MARIRRQKPSGTTTGKPTASQIIWLIAVYIRLSREDGNEESESVTNQKKILAEYLEQYFEGEYEIVDYYIEARQRRRHEAL